MHNLKIFIYTECDVDAHFTRHLKSVAINHSYNLPICSRLERESLASPLLVAFI